VNTAKPFVASSPCRLHLHLFFCSTDPDVTQLESLAWPARRVLIGGSYSSPKTSSPIPNSFRSTPFHTALACSQPVANSILELPGPGFCHENIGPAHNYQHLLVPTFVVPATLLDHRPTRRRLVRLKMLPYINARTLAPLMLSYLWMRQAALLTCATAFDFLSPKLGTPSDDRELTQVPLPRSQHCRN
jgi:hypothetical protein